MSEGRTKRINYVRSMSNKAVIKFMENIAIHQLFLGAILGFAAAVPSFIFARALLRMLDGLVEVRDPNFRIKTEWTLSGGIHGRPFVWFCLVITQTER